jgi:hypothetical protein
MLWKDALMLEDLVGPSIVAPGDGVRALVFSMRGLTQHVSRCASYEFENVIAECDDVDLVAPKRPPQRGEGAFRRHVKKILRLTDPLIEDNVDPNKEYDLFVAFARSMRDLQFVEPIMSLRDQCRASVTLLDELRSDAVNRSPRSVKVLSRFDCIFSGIQESVETIQRVTGRPCHYLPGGVDALRFCPYPRNSARSIDVYSMGRRKPAVHEVLMSRGASGNLFYLYDTTSDFAVIDPMEHRLLLANLIKRSRYFITFPPKFDRPAEAPGQLDVGLRFFEGAAGGAVMLGTPPNGATFQECFDWPDAVIRTTPDGGEIVALIADLDEQPDRLNRVRRDNVENSLRRHDWIYRWRRMLEIVGVPISSGVIKRERCLTRLADLVAADGVSH